MASQDDSKALDELQADYVDNETKKGAVASVAVGAVIGGGTGLAVGAEAGAALVIGGAVAIPAVVGAVVIGAIGAGITNIVSKNRKIEALEKDGLKKSIQGAKARLLASTKKMVRLKDEHTANDQKRKKLLNVISTTKENVEKQEAIFKQQMKEHGYSRSSMQTIIVMIGKTGHGKSTLGNRICGDTSTKGKEGPFSVSANKHKAGTSKVSSTITTAPFRTDDNEGQVLPNNPTDDDVKVEQDEVDLEIIDLDDVKQDEEESSLLIVDTPGFGDVQADNRDDHKNLVVRYLKGCGGINSFILVISDSDRIDASIQQMLTEYEKMFGIEFWKHLTIVVTRVDDEDDLEDFAKENHVTDIQQLLKQKFKDLKSLNRDIPVIPFGKKIYSKQISFIVDEIPNDKFTCDALKGPFELLKEKYDGLLINLEAIDQKLATLQKDIANTGKEMEDRKKEIDTLKSQLNKK